MTATMIEVKQIWFDENIETCKDNCLASCWSLYMQNIQCRIS